MLPPQNRPKPVVPLSDSDPIRKIAVSDRQAQLLAGAGFSTIGAFRLTCDKTALWQAIGNRKNAAGVLFRAWDNGVQPVHMAEPLLVVDASGKPPRSAVPFLRAADYVLMHRGGLSSFVFQAMHFPPVANRFCTEEQLTDGGAGVDSVAARLFTGVQELYRRDLRQWIVDVDRRDSTDLDVVPRGTGVEEYVTAHMAQQLKHSSNEGLC